MKLILCLDCQDIVPLNHQYVVECDCRLSGGRYIVDEYAEYWGNKVIPLGISNPSLADAITKNSDTGESICFDAFVMSEDDHMIRVEPPPEKEEVETVEAEIVEETLLLDDHSDEEENEDDNFEDDERKWIRNSWSWVEEHPNTHVAVDLDSGMILISEEDEDKFNRELNQLLKEDEDFDPFIFFTTDVLIG